MATESTNDWVVENYRESDYYYEPVNVLAYPVDVDITERMVWFDLYKGATKKASVAYLISVNSTDSEKESRMWSEIENAKTKYLQEKYA